MNRRIFITSLAAASLVSFSVASRRDESELHTITSAREVTLAVDPIIQTLAERYIRDVVRQRARRNQLPRDADIGFVCLHNSTGNVLGYTPTSQEHSEVDNCRTRTRDVGSIPKPLFYAFGLDSGAISPADTFVDEPTTFSRLDHSGEYSAQNYGGNYTHQPLTIVDAIAFSSNVAMLKAYHRFDQRLLRRQLQALDLPVDGANVNLMALGRWTPPLLNLASAFTALPNGGSRVAPRFIATITTHKDRNVTEIPVRRNRVFNAAACELVLEGMRSCLTRGTGRRAASDLSNVARAKTGSSQDSLAALMTRELTMLLWVGRRNSNRDLRITGGALALPLLGTLLRNLMRERPELAPAWN